MNEIVAVIRELALITVMVVLVMSTFKFNLTITVGKTKVNITNKEKRGK